MKAARALLVGALLCLTVQAQEMGPPNDPRAEVARRALAAAAELMQVNRGLPRASIYQIGLLQALSGDAEQGLATITAEPDPDGPHGPRWDSLVTLAHDLAAAGQTEPVQRLAAQQLGADRAALLTGLTVAQFEAGQPLAAMLNAQAIAETDPIIAADLLLDEAEAQPDPSIELLGRALEAGRLIPPNARTDTGESAQARALDRLLAVQVAAGRDDAALQAAEAVGDRTARQAPLLSLAVRQAQAGRLDAALDTATKLSPELPTPGASASYQTTAFARLADVRLAVGDGDGAAAAAGRAGLSARQTVDNQVRVHSLLLAGEANARANQPNAAISLVTQALADLHLRDQTLRTLVLLKAAQVQSLAGQPETATTTFAAAREVAGIAATPAALDAAVTIPAEIGEFKQAEAGLTLRGEPEAQRAGRLLLVATLAEHGYLAAAIERARSFDPLKPQERGLRVAALVAVARQAGSDSSAELLQEAVASAADPLDLAGLHQIGAAAAELGLPGVALAAYGATLESAAKIKLPEQTLGLDRLLTAVTTAIRTRAEDGVDLARIAAEAEAAAMNTRDPMARAAALTLIGRAIGDLGARDSAERLLVAAAREARQVTGEIRLIQALAEHGAAAAETGFPQQARSSFDAAEAMMDYLDRVPAVALLILSETEAQANRSTAERFLLRTLLTIESFQREGSTDLRRLAQVAAYSELLADSLAMVRRIYHPSERLDGYLHLARIALGLPVAPLRQQDYYPLPERIYLGAEG